MPNKGIYEGQPVNIMDIALGIEVGICSNRVLERRYNYAVDGSQ